MSATVVLRASSLLLLLFVSLATSYVIDPPSPVPSTEAGIRYQPYDPRPTTKLEMFLEIHCPDSRNAWPIIKNLSEYYGPSRLDIVVHQQPLPYHRNAFLATQGVFVIRDQLPSRVFDYIEANFANLQYFTSSATVNKTETEIIDMLADLAVTSTGIDKDYFKSNLARYAGYVVTIWKYAVRRVVYAVPTYFVNGVEVGIGNNRPTFDDWVTFLDPIINPGRRRRPQQFRLRSYNYRQNN